MMIISETQKFSLKSGFVLELLKQTPAYIFWKDRNSVYLGCNNVLAQALGLSSPAEIVGKTDYDLSTTKNESDLYRSEDQQVIDSHEPKFNLEEYQTLPDGRKVALLTNKAPLFDKKNNVIGVIGNSMVITEIKSKQITPRNEKEKPGSTIKLLDEKNHDNLVTLQDTLNHIQQRRYYLTGKFKGIYLTKREAEALLCLTRGFTSKQTASTLKISHRTVESLVVQLKNKLNCNLRSELISAAIEGGFLKCMVPVT